MRKLSVISLVLALFLILSLYGPAFGGGGGPEDPACLEDPFPDASQCDKTEVKGPITVARAAPCAIVPNTYSVHIVLESKKKVKKDDGGGGGGDDCSECDGKVTEMTLQYNGSQTATIKVEQKKHKVIVFEDTVGPGEQFTVIGADKKGTLGTEVFIFVDGELNTKIHTSCSKPIGPGLVFGDFTVIEAFSLKGGLICPVNDDDKKKKKKSKEVHLFSFSTPLGEGDLCALNEDDFLDLFFRIPCSLGVQDAFGFDGIAVIKKLEIVNKENCGTPAEMIRLEAVVCDVP